MNHQPEANPAQTLPGKATKVMGGKKAKAADVQKQMESWMKQNNKKKDKPMSKEEADALRYDSYRMTNFQNLKNDHRDEMVTKNAQISNIEILSIFIL